MTERLFVPQEELEQWLEEGKAIFENGTLSLVGAGGPFSLVPAVTVTSVLDGEDTAELCGTVRLVSELEALGAEHYAGSTLLGDTAYECIEGFAGDLPDVQDKAEPPSPAPAISQAKEEPPSDSDLLADFLLRHL